MSQRDLSRRLAVAALGIPVGVAVVYLGAWSVGGVLGAIAALGCAEVYHLAKARGQRPFPWLGVPVAAWLVVSAAWAEGLAQWSAWGWMTVLALTLGSLAAAVFLRGPTGGPLQAVAATVLGPVYVGGTLGFGVQLRAFPGISDGAPGWEGAMALIFVLTVTWVGDSGAYFAGSNWGKRKLIPAVSPSKTVEGAIGGLVGAAASAAIFSFALLDPTRGLTLAPFAAGVLGLVIGAVAQLGDLTESVLKRDAGVKDSGTLLPGHGGALDRFDAVFFTLPVVYFLLPFFLT